MKACLLIAGRSLHYARTFRQSATRLPRLVLHFHEFQACLSQLPHLALVYALYRGENSAIYDSYLPETAVLNARDSSAKWHKTRNRFGEFSISSVNVAIVIRQRCRHHLFSMPVPSRRVACIISLRCPCRSSALFPVCRCLADKKMPRPNIRTRHRRIKSMTLCGGVCLSLSNAYRRLYM